MLNADCATNNSPDAAISSRLEPYRSSSTPTGTCIAAYTVSCTTVKLASADAEMWKRSAACRPATLIEPRCSTVTR